MLTYRCPTAGKIVRTGIDASREDLRRLQSFKLSVWCPHCQTGHTITGREATVVSDELAAAA